MIASIRALADIFDLKGFYVWHVVMVSLLCVTWLVLFILTLVAFWRGEILMAKPEDVVIDRMGVKELEEMEKRNNMRSETPDVEKAYEGFGKIQSTSKPL